MAVRVELEFRPFQMEPEDSGDLLEEIAALGYDVGMSETVHLRTLTYELIVWVGENIGEPAFITLVGTVMGWYARKLIDRRRQPPHVRVLYREDGSEPKRVKIKRPKD